MDMKEVEEKVNEKAPFSAATSDLVDMIEGDIPEFYLQGTIPGAKSQDASEDPNFTVVTDGVQPGSLYWSDTERLKRQAASEGRYEFDPIYRGVLDGFLYFIIGRGFKMSATDENPAVQEFLDEFKKASRFDGRDREIVLKFLKTGEVFVRFFKKAENRDARIPVIRLLNYYEIREIETDPNDRETPKTYIRKYKDNNNAVAEEKIPADEILHIKFGDMDQKRGNPPFSQIAQACQYYLDWVRNRVILNRMKTSYYLEEIVDGSPSHVSTQDATSPNQNRTSKTGQLIKRMPKFGSKLIHNKAVEYKWLKPEVGADDAKEDGRVIRLTICAGGQCPEFLLGDASNANYSSTLVSQNPFVRKVEFMQDFLEPAFCAIFERILEHAVAGKFLPANSTETITFEKAGWFKRTLLKFKGLLPASEDVQNKKRGTLLTEKLDTQGNAVKKKVVATKTTVKIQWPTLIAQDVLKDSQALQIHQGMGIVSNQTLQEKLGYDPEEETRRLEQEAENAAQNEPDDDDLAGAKRDAAAGNDAGAGAKGKKAKGNATDPEETND